MGTSLFKPGDEVPETGIYRIDHDSHRLMHEATLLKGERFPRCKVCKNEVRFPLIRAVFRQAIPFRSNEMLEAFDDDETTRSARAG